MMQPLLVGIIWDALMGLGLGVQIVVAVVLLAIALEMRRVLKTGARVGTFLTSAFMYVLVGLVAVAVVIGLGWADPNVGEFAGDIGRWGGEALRFVGRWARNLLP